MICLVRFAKNSAASCLIFLFIFLSTVFSPALALDKPYDHSVWDQFLKQYVNEKGEVDYQGVKAHPELLNQYLDQIKNIDAKAVGTMIRWPREEQMAFWLNAYHAIMIKTIADYYPIKSTNEIPDFWDTEYQKVWGKFISLKKIQQLKLVEAFRDEKIYFALSCGAKDCPKMMREAFTGPRVEGQLYLAAKNFVNDPSRVEIISGKKTIRLSKLFEWYSKDFVLDFGTWENERGFSDQQFAVLSFIHNYLTDPEKIRWMEEGHYKVKYLAFDWSLDEWHRTSQSDSASPASK